MRRPTGGETRTHVRRVGAAQKARDLVQGTLRGRETNPLRRGPTPGSQALERQREVRAALGRNERVNLVDDDRVQTDEGVACA